MNKIDKPLTAEETLNKVFGDFDFKTFTEILTKEAVDKIFTAMKDYATQEKAEAFNKGVELQREIILESMKGNGIDSLVTVINSKKPVNPYNTKK